MNDNERLTTSGSIRQFLADTMVQIRNKEISIEAALAIAAQAKQITAGMQGEVNVHKARAQMLGHGRGMAQFGSLQLDDVNPPMGTMRIGDGTVSQQEKLK